MMHSTENLGSTGVPAFLHKLWTLVEDESTNDLIAWDPNGLSFHVYEQSRFSKEVLPHYFKHSNIASFIRQLNMYGFRKVSNVEHGGLKIEKDDMEFIHPFFQRGQEHLLDNIKRKVASSKSDDVRLKSDDVSKVLRDVHSLKGRQENITSKMDALERENEALWREVASLRQKHLKQQKIVNKLIQFLVTLVGNRGLGGGGGGVKRKIPLMINDVSQLSSGPPPAKLQRQYSLENNSLKASNIEVLPTVESPDPVSGTSSLQSGGVKIEEMVDVGQPQTTIPEYRVINTGVAAGTGQPQTYIIINPNTSTQKSIGAQPVKSVVGGSQKLVVTNPAPPSLSSAPTLSLQAVPSSSGSAQFSTTSTTGATPQQVGYSLLKKIQAETVTAEEPVSDTDPVFSAISVTPSRKSTQAVAIPEHSKPSTTVLSDMSTQLSSMDNSLDDLRDLLAGNVDLSGLRLDTDTLQGLFTPEAPIPQTPEGLFNLTDEGRPDFSNTDNITGNEMVQYNPPDDLGALFDLGVDSPGEAEEEDIVLPETVIEDLMTPSLELSSPLAQRRKSKNSTITTEEVD